MILVTGATGTIGQRVVARLAGRGGQFRALVRAPERGVTGPRCRDGYGGLRAPREFARRARSG